MLKDKAIAVTPNNGSHFTTLKMMEGFLAPEHIKTHHAGSMLKRLEAVRDGKVAAASLMEPWISVAQKWGLRILIESHSTRSEAAGDDLDGATLRKMFRAQARAVKELEKDPTPYIHYFIARDRRPAGAARVPDLAAAARPAAALHARAVRRHLQLDGQVEHDGARRDLREHRRQSGVAVGNAYRQGGEFMGRVAPRRGRGGGRRGEGGGGGGGCRPTEGAMTSSRRRGVDGDEMTLGAVFSDVSIEVAAGDVSGSFRRGAAVFGRGQSLGLESVHRLSRPAD